MRIEPGARYRKGGAKNCVRDMPDNIYCEPQTSRRCRQWSLWPLLRDGHQM